MSQNRKGQDDLMAYRDQSGGNPNMANNQNNFSQQAARQYADHDRLKQQANSANTNTSSKALSQALQQEALRKQFDNASNVNVTNHVSNMNYSNNQKLEEERRKYSSNSYENVKTRLGKITGSKAWMIPSMMAGFSRHIFNKPGVIEERLRADARTQQEHLQELRKQAAENKQNILRNIAEEKRLRLIDQRKLEAQAATAKGSDPDFNRKLASSQATSQEKYFTSQEIQKMSDQELLRHSYAAGRLPHRSAGGLLRDTQQEKLLKDQAMQQTSHISPDRRDEVMSRIAEHKGGHERYLSPAQVSSMSKDRLQSEAISQGLTSKGLFPPIASTMYNPLAGALLAGGVRSFTQAQNTSKHLALDKHRKQLGGIGKVQQAGNITMGVGRMAHSVAMMGALGSMIPGIGSSIAPEGAAPIRSPLGHVMKAGSSLLAPTLGGPLGMLLPALAVMLPSLIGNIGVNRKLKRILGKPPSEKELTRASIADQMEPYLKRLIVDGQIDGAQQLMIRYLSAIETHTSVLHEMGRIAMEKDDTEKKATERNKEILDPKPEKQSWLTKIEHLMSLTHAKYNPMYQLFMTLFGRKSPKQVIADLKSSKETPEKKEKVRSLGIRLAEHMLLSMPAFRIASRGYTWQDKMLLLASSTYDVLALTARETVTIRRHGYGIRENAFKDKTIKKKGVDFSKVSDAMMGFLNKIPVVSAGANIVRDIFKLPSMMRSGASKVYNTAADLFFGKEFRRLQDRKELDKALGHDKSTNQLADEYIANGLPSVMENIRSYAAKQYEALLNIYDMTRSQFQLLSGVHTGKVPNIQFQRHLTEEIKDAKGNITFKDHTEKRIWDKIDARRYTKDAAKQATTRRVGEAQDLQANVWSRSLHGILTKSLLSGKLGQNTLAEQMTKKLQKFNTVDDYIQKYLFGQDVDHDRHIRPFMVGDKELEKEEKRTFFKSAKSFLTDRPARTAMTDDKSSKVESADEQRKQLFVRLIGSLGPLAGLALAGPAGLPLIAGLLGGGAAGAGLTGFAKHKQDVNLDKFEWTNLNAVKDIETRFTEMQHQGMGASSLLSPNLFDSSDIKNPQQQNIIFLQEIRDELIILNDWQSDIFDELEKSNIKQDNIYTELQNITDWQSILYLELMSVNRRILLFQEIHDELQSINEFQKNSIYTELKETTKEIKSIKTSITSLNSYIAFLANEIKDSIKTLYTDVKDSIKIATNNILTKFETLIGHASRTEEYLRNISEVFNNPVPVIIRQNIVSPDDYVNVSIRESHITNTNPMIVRNVDLPDISTDTTQEDDPTPTRAPVSSMDEYRRRQQERERRRNVPVVPIQEAVSKGGFFDKYKSSVVLIGEGKTGNIKKSAEIMMKYPDGSVQIIGMDETQKILKNLNISKIDEWKSLSQEELLDKLSKTNIKSDASYKEEFSKNKWYKSGLADVIDKLPQFKKYSPYTKLGYASIFSKLDEVLDTAKNKLRKSDTRTKTIPGSKEEIDRYNRESKEDKISEFIKLIQAKENKDKDVKSFYKNIEEMKNLLKDDNLLNKENKVPFKELLDSLELAVQNNDTMLKVLTKFDVDDNIENIKTRLFEGKKDRKEYKEDQIKELLEIIQKAENQDKSTIEFQENIKNIKDLLENDTVLNEDTRNLTKDIIDSLDSAAQDNRKLHDILGEMSEEGKLSTIETNLQRHDQERKEKFQEETQKSILDVLNRMYKHSKKKVTDVFKTDKSAKNIFDDLISTVLPKILLGLAGVAAFSSLMKLDNVKKYMTHAANAFMESPNLGVVGLAATGAFLGAKFLGLPGMLLGGLLGAGLSYFAPSLSDKSEAEKQAFRDGLKNKLVSDPKLLFGATTGLAVSTALIGARFGLPGLIIGGLVGAGLGLFGIDYLLKDDPSKQEEFRNSIWEKVTSVLTPTNLAIAGGGLGIFALMKGSKGLGLASLPAIAMLGGAAALVAPLFMDMSDTERKDLYGKISEELGKHKFLTAVIGAGAGFTLLGKINPIAGLVGALIGGTLGYSFSNIAKAFGDAEKEGGKLNIGKIITDVIAESDILSAVTGASIGWKLGLIAGGPLGAVAGLLIGGVMGYGLSHILKMFKSDDVERADEIISGIPSYVDTPTEQVSSKYDEILKEEKDKLEKSGQQYTPEELRKNVELRVQETYKDDKNKARKKASEELLNQEAFDARLKTLQTGGNKATIDYKQELKSQYRGAENKEDLNALRERVRQKLLHERPAQLEEINRLLDDTDKFNLLLEEVKKEDDHYQGSIKHGNEILSTVDSGLRTVVNAPGDAAKWWYNENFNSQPKTDTKYLGGLLDLEDSKYDKPKFTLVGEGGGPTISPTAEIVVGSRVYSTRHSQKILKDNDITTIDQWKNLTPEQYNNLHKQLEDYRQSDHKELGKISNSPYTQLGVAHADEDRGDTSLLKGSSTVINNQPPTLQSDRSREIQDIDRQINSGRLTPVQYQNLVNRRLELEREQKELENKNKMFEPGFLDRVAAGESGDINDFMNPIHHQDLEDQRHQESLQMSAGIIPNNRVFGEEDVYTSSSKYQDLEDERLQENKLISQPKTFMDTGHVDAEMSSGIGEKKESWTSRFFKSIFDSIFSLFDLYPSGKNSNSSGRSGIGRSSHLGGGANISNVTNNDVIKAIKDASDITGVDFGYLMAKAQQESSFNPNARAGTSNASGLFQFVPGTRREMVQRYGSFAEQHGINRRDFDNPFNPRGSALMGALYAKENADGFRKRFGRDPNATELYFMHFLGPGGGSRFLRAYNKDRNLFGKDVLDADQVRANSSVFFTNGKPNTVDHIYNVYDNKIGKNAAAYAAKYKDLSFESAKDEREKTLQRLGGNNSFGGILGTPGHKIRLTSGFAPRGSGFHKGIDLVGPRPGMTGYPVWSAEAGEVIYSGDRGDYGKTVEIDHGKGISTLYAHLNSISHGIIKGRKLDKGTRLGGMGNTGASRGDHLHFEVRDKKDTRFKNNQVNPLLFLNNLPSTVDPNGETCKDGAETGGADGIIDATNQKHKEIGGGDLDTLIQNYESKYKNSEYEDLKKLEEQLYKKYPNNQYIQKMIQMEENEDQGFYQEYKPPKRKTRDGNSDFFFWINHKSDYFKDRIELLKKVIEKEKSKQQSQSALANFAGSGKSPGITSSPVTQEEVKPEEKITVDVGRKASGMIDATNQKHVDGSKSNIEKGQSIIDSYKSAYDESDFNKLEELENKFNKLFQDEEFKSNQILSLYGTHSEMVKKGRLRETRESFPEMWHVREQVEYFSNRIAKMKDILEEEKSKQQSQNTLASFAGSSKSPKSPGITSSPVTQEEVKPEEKITADVGRKASGMKDIMGGGTPKSPGITPSPPTVENVKPVDTNVNYNQEKADSNFKALTDGYEPDKQIQQAISGADELQSARMESKQPSPPPAPVASQSQSSPSITNNTNTTTTHQSRETPNSLIKCIIDKVFANTEVLIERHIHDFAGFELA